MKMFAILVSDNHDELQWIKVGAYFDIRTRQYQPVGGRGDFGVGQRIPSLI